VEEEIRTLDGAVLRSGEARKLSEVSKQTREVYRDPATLMRKERAQLIHGPTELLKAILDEGAKGQQMQRYKGLGEMNPDQLWETTLDPEARTLLQVKIDDLAEADDIFTKLMGDVVEPRREFIQANALSVENLDFSAPGRGCGATPPNCGAWPRAGASMPMSNRPTAF
jgi:DNA gyrase subunit B